MATYLILHRTLSNEENLHILEAHNYENHGWHIYGNRKLTDISYLRVDPLCRMDRQKISVFCLRDSRYTEQRYTVREWPRIQEEVTPCKHDLKRNLLVDPQNIFF